MWTLTPSIGNITFLATPKCDKSGKHHFLTNLGRCIVGMFNCIVPDVLERLP